MPEALSVLHSVGICLEWGHDRRRNHRIDPAYDYVVH